MPSLKKNIIYSSILTTANYVFPILTYPYVSRVLEVSNIGAVNFVDSIINYFVMFSMMGISITGIREIASSHRNQSKMNSVFSSLITLNLITTFLGLVILIAAMFIVPQLAPYKELLSIGALKLIFNLFLIEWFYKGIEAFKFITQRTIIVKLIYVASVFIFVRNINDRNIYYFLTVMMIVVNAIINIWHSHKYVKFSFKEISLKPQLKSFLRMGIYMILTSLYTTFNVTYLGFVSSDVQVGYYTTATKIYAILLALFTAFTGVMMPRMSALLSEGKMEEFKVKLFKSVNLLFLFAIPVIIYSEIMAPDMIMLISGSGYQGAVTPFRITIPLMLIIGMEQILVIQTMMPLKLDRIILRNSVITAILGVILNILIVKSLQSIGSSLVWLICESVLLVLAQISVTSKINIQFPWTALLHKFALFIPLGLILPLIYLKEFSYITNIIVTGCIWIMYIIFITYITKDPILFELLAKLTKR